MTKKNDLRKISLCISLALLCTELVSCAPVTVYGKRLLASTAVDSTSVATPTPTPTPATHYQRQLVSGDAHSCFVDSDGSLKCWGDNSNAQIKQPPQLVTGSSFRSDSCYYNSVGHFKYL